MSRAMSWADRSMHARVVGVPTWTEKPSPRWFPDTQFPALCKRAPPVQRRWVHTNPPVILACMIGWYDVIPLHGGSLWSSHVSLYRRFRGRYSISWYACPSFLLRVNRSLLFYGVTIPICGGSRGSRLAGSSEISRSSSSQGMGHGPPTNS